MDPITDIMMLRPWLHRPFVATQHLTFETTRPVVPSRSYHHFLHDPVRPHPLLQHHHLQRETGQGIARNYVLKPIAIRLSDVYSAVPLALSLRERSANPDFGLERLRGDKCTQFDLGAERCHGMSPTGYENSRELFPCTQRGSTTGRMDEIFREFLNMRLRFLHTKDECVGAGKGFASPIRSDGLIAPTECAPSRHCDGDFFSKRDKQIGSSRSHVSLNRPIPEENNLVARLLKATAQPPPEFSQKLSSGEGRKSNKRFLTPVTNINKVRNKRKPILGGRPLDNTNKKPREHLEPSSSTYHIDSSHVYREHGVSQNTVSETGEHLAIVDHTILDNKNTLKEVTCTAATKQEGNDERGKFHSSKSVKVLRLISSVKRLSADRKAFKCHQCRYVTDRKNNLKRHVITMHQVSAKTLECCGVSFQSKASLRDHNAVFHRSGYRCQICSRNFCRKALLRRHLTVHSGQKDFFCDMCGYATSHKSNLERHQKVHNKKEVTSLVAQQDFFQKRMRTKSSPKSPDVCSDSTFGPHYKNTPVKITTDASSVKEYWKTGETILKSSHETSPTSVYLQNERLVVGENSQTNFIDTTTGRVL